MARVQDDVDADWEDAELDMPHLEAQPFGAVPDMLNGGVMPGSSQATMPGGMPQAGGGPQQIDPKLVKKWNCIYPCYLNPRKKVSEGRRLPLHLLVGCECNLPKT